MYGNPGRGSVFAFPVGASGMCAVRSSRASRFQRPLSACTRFKLGSVRSRRAISSRPRSREVRRRAAVTSLARSMGSAPNAGSSYTTRLSRSNPGRGSSRSCTEPISTGRPTPELMEEAIRDFRREAPGRKRNSTSSSKAAATTIRRLEEKNVTAPLLERRGASSYKLEGALPPCLIEKVQDNFAQKQNTITPGGLQILIIRGLKRPVDKHGTPNDVFPGYESPVAAVQAHAAMVSHAKVVIRWYYDVVALYGRRHIDRPVGPHIGIIVGGHRREIVAVRIHRVPVMQHIRFIQRLAVAIHHAVPQVNPVSGHANDALHDIKSRGLGRQKHHDIPKPHVPIGKQRAHPRTPGRELDAVHKNVIADQQRVLHRTRWNLKRLHHKRDDEQPGYQHRCQRGEKLDRGLLRLLFLFLRRGRLAGSLL